MLTDQLHARVRFPKEEVRLPTKTRAPENGDLQKT